MTRNKASSPAEPHERPPGDEGSSASGSRRGFKETLELAGKLLIGLAGLCYVLGLIVVSIHLRSYGLNSLSLSQLHYVTAGVWVLLPVLVMVFLIIFGKFVVEAQEDRWKGKTKFAKAIDIVPALVGVVIAFYVVVEYLGRPFGIRLSLVSWVLIPAVGMLSLSSLAAAMAMLLSTAPDRPPIWVSLGVGVFSIFMFMAYIVLFAGHAYQDIPWATGGGRPSQVTFVTAAETKPHLESVGIRFSTGQNRTESLKLLLATEKEYVVINPEGKTVSIPVDAVKAVLYEK